ncbi:hypothetical protein ACT3TI_11520 [Psychrobacter sp. AOP22-C1-22]|uniref:hypothetical protein n=1 Tax=unclassified Psychrobacter TaxID=196806 RepID=UPI0017883E81|nr:MULTISPECIES: hypothetical protein [unclassified Psychrobacter]MDN5802183.1 hypothetical protein [Psychrobacter sp.]MBE0407484.1 hypothetical protein [Psychrobacter sp. FME6]MBE0445640.1 hypothetical protein [Psychrobacter sp. FME5]MDN5891775.1 hypothetical protein [Psychrobacter sp.]MDN5897361.1 hypothetical protein [Psychrobacter sp.]
MDSPTLPTQLDMNNPHAELDNTLPTSVSNDTVLDSDGQSISAETKNSPQAHTQTIDPNAIILAEALTDKTISWRIHNCKVSKKTVTQDLPLPFLYHYDSLDDAIKQTHPLTPSLLAQFNTPMTANDAAKLIGINAELISSPWHVKVVGSLVVFSEALQLAVRLHWTNTGKETQQIYTRNEADAITAAVKDWQFFGRVDVLYKNDKQALVSIDGTSVDEASNEPIPLIIDASQDYQFLPATHALVVIAKLEADKAELPWFESAILERLA